MATPASPVVRSFQTSAAANAPSSAAALGSTPEKSGWAAPA